jgi:chromosome segregation ATPase
LVVNQDALDEEIDMSTPGRETALARLQARREQIEQELKQVERQIVAARLQVVTLEQRITRLTRRQRQAA